MPVPTAPTEMPAAEAPPVWVFTANVEEGLSVNRIDGRFGAQAGVLAQSRYQMRATPVGLVDNQFQVPIVRPYLRAHVLVPWVRLFVQAELAGTPRLLDLELDVQPMPWLGLKFGQFVTPFSRAFMTMVPKFLMPTLSIANTYYRADRDTGVMLYGMPAQGRLEYFAGVFNGNGIDKTTNDNREFSYVARFAGTPFGDAPNTTGHVHYDDTPTLAGPVRPTLQLGINGSYNHTAPTTQVIDAATMQFVTRPLETHRLLTGGIDGQFRVSYFVLQGEFFIRRDAPDNARPVVSMGGSAQTSVMLVPKWFELAARFALVNLNVADAVPAQIETYELQAATYPIGNHLKGIVSYTLGRSRGALLGYPDGFSHTVLAQAQLWL